MKNKLKIVVAVVTVIAGMVLYKNHVDKKEREKEDRKHSSHSKASDRYSVN
jgi:hypothetical protein